ERDRAIAWKRHVIRADVLRDAARFTRDDVRLADVIEQRGLAVVDVTHDGDDGRTRDEIFRRVLLEQRLGIGGVLVLEHGLETEFASDQLDLTEVESLIDRDHEAEVLECEANDLVTGHLELLRKLGDGNELVDAYRFPFLLNSGLALRLHFFARHCFVAAWRALARASAHGRHRLEDIGRYGFLIYATTAT